jgi:LysM domain
LSATPNESAAETARLKRYAGAARDAEYVQQSDAILGRKANDAWAAMREQQWVDQSDAILARRSVMEPTLDDRSLLNASERASNPSAYASVAGRRYVVQDGDVLSGIAGSSRPAAIGAIMAANNLTNSGIRAGLALFVPESANAYGDQSALGQAALNGDNARLAALARERFNFGDSQDARDVRQGFGYQSRLSRELSNLTSGTPSSYAVGEMRAVQPSAWEQIYGSPDVQHVMNHTITGQFILKPLLGAAGTVSALVRDDNYDFSKLRGVYGTELQQAKENLAIGIGTAFVPWPGKGLSSELTTGYRVEGLGNQRMLIGATGEVEIPTVLTDKGRGPERLLYVGFDEARAQKFLQQRLEQFPDNRITTFEVPREFVYELRSTAVAEVERSVYPSRPVIADPTKASDQFGLTAQQIERLREVVVQGSGKRQ